ncbi:hypothetical protein BH23ACT9_BH23ACT9_36230 [soil metagenome]
MSLSSSDLFDKLRALRAAPPAWPAVTVSVPGDATDPAHALARLRSQVDEAGKALETALAPATPEDEGSAKRRLAAMRQRLAAAAETAEGILRGSDGVVILIADDADGGQLDEVLALSAVASDRAVVASRFALADLVRTADRTDHYRVLVLSEQDARVLEATGGDMVEHRRHGWPHTESGQRGTGVGVQGSRVSHSAHGDAKRDQWLRDLDHRLADVIAAEGDLPLVLVGIRDYRDAFTTVRKTTSEIAAHIDGSHGQTHLSQLADTIWSAAEEAFTARRTAVLEELDGAKGAKRFVSGVDEVFRAATEGRLELAVIDDDAVVPALLSAAGRLETGTDDQPLDTTTAPDVRDGVEAVFDDVLDEIAARTLETGGRAVFATDLGRWTDFGPVMGAVRW